MKAISFKTVGCRLNQAETAQMAASFRSAGWKIVPFGDPCDACVIHTCAVTVNAERDCLRLARSVKRMNRNTTVILAGCAAEVEGEQLLKKCGADMIAGQRAKFHLPRLLQSPPGSRNSLQELPLFNSTRALIRVQDGCDFCCSYCIVPAARGRPVSRPFKEIVDEARALAGQGFKEVILTGANLGCYSDGTLKITSLLERLEKIPGISRIRLSSIEISTVEREIINYMAGSGKLCRSIHIPLQSGDNNILRLMGRHYTAEQYRNLIDYAVARIPLLGLGTDIITGFPGETEEAFNNTKQLIIDFPFSNLHVFTYSRRPGTKAASMPGQVNRGEGKQRSKELIEIGREKKKAFASHFLGRKVSVLVETVKNNTGHGWTEEYIEACVSQPALTSNEIIDFIPSSCLDGILR